MHLRYFPKKIFALLVCAVTSLHTVPAYGDGDVIRGVLTKENAETAARADDFAYLDSVVTAESAIMLDAESGIVLYEKNADEPLYPASTTKVMTALLLLEYVKEQNGEITESNYAGIFKTRVIPFSHYAVYSIEYGSSNIGMYEGDTLSVEEALYAIMLPSANEVAAAVGEYVAGSETYFAVLMTKRAMELGCKNTRFMNAHGLTDENHYTTARDLALILREAVKHKEFTEAISTRYYAIPPTEQQPLTREFSNTNKLIQQGEFYNPYVIGGKTGYTDEARHTLVSYAEKDGVKLVTAVMKAEKNFTYRDTNAMLDYGLNAFTRFTAGIFTAEIGVTVYDGASDAGVLDGSAQTLKLPVRTRDAVDFLLPRWVNTDDIKCELVYGELTASGGYKSGEEIKGAILRLYDENATFGGLLDKKSYFAALPLYAVETVTPAPPPAPVKEPLETRPVKAAQNGGAPIDASANAEISPVFAPSAVTEDAPRDKRLLIAAIVAAAIGVSIFGASMTAKIVLGKRKTRGKYKFGKNLFK